MCRKKTLTFALAVLLVAGSQTQAVLKDKVFTSDGIISEGDWYANVYIYDTPPHRTTVSMFGGRVSLIQSYDSSIFNMTGGITEACAYNQSNINVVGGTIFTLNSYDYSNVNVFGGQVNGITAYDTSTINVLDNANLFALFASDSGVINMTGGVTMSIAVGKFGTVNLLGGLVSDTLWAGDSGIINIYGYGLAKFPTDGHYDFGFVSGEWSDRTAFNIDLSGADTYSHIVLYNIPEPTTVLLIAIGGVCLRKRRAF
jgi:hypothetical protein